MTSPVAPAPSILQLKITLHGSKPPIWRRVLVSSAMTLADLHTVIQVVMGWEDSHLHAFDIHQEQYSLPYDDDMGMDDYLDSSAVHLSELGLAEKLRFYYVYDFGDDWEHVIQVEKVLPAEPARALPVCVAGKRAGPPEDSGGVWGYAGKLEILRQPDHPDYDDIAEWMGEWDAEAFDLAAINAALQSAV